MNERAALLHAVCANPDDDTARLVFADWLTEHGEGERAEFIRGQIACDLDNFDTGTVKFVPLAGYERNPAVVQRVELEYRTLILAARHRPAWLAALAGRTPDDSTDLGYRYGPFYHGFVFSLFVSHPDPFLKDWPVIFQSAPITELELSCTVPLRAVAGPGFERVRELRITPGCELTLRDVATLTELANESPHLRVFVAAEQPDDRVTALRRVFGDRLRWQFNRS
ncbi:MAG TPA: TIGR02996 domain-containing protein [Gemmata sp.]